jgi:hypothetical protein
VGLWLPLSFHALFDAQEIPKDILNSNLRASVMLKGQFGFPNRWRIGQDGHIGVRFVPFGQDNSDLGGVFTTISAVLSPGFKRVNVAYDYWELGGSFEPNFQNGKVQLNLRGGILKVSGDGGWYDPILLVPLGELILPSRRNYQPYAGFEMTLIRPDKSGGAVSPFISVDIRNRTVFDYGRLSPEQSEDTQVSVNAMLGVKIDPGGSFLQPIYYFRYYHGVNPEGQFQSQRNYQVFGLGVQFVFR